MRRALAGVFCLGILVLLLWRGCDENEGALLPSSLRLAPAVDLKPTEQTKVVFSPAKRRVTYTTRQPDGKVVHKVVDSVHKYEVIVSKSGQVSLKVRRWGFLLQPGLGLVYDRGIRPSGDLLFFEGMGFGAHLGLYKRDTFRVYAAGSYSLRRIHLANVGLVAGVTLQGDVVAGVRIALN